MLAAVGLRSLNESIDTVSFDRHRSRTCPLHVAVGTMPWSLVTQLQLERLVLAPCWTKSISIAALVVVLELLVRTAVRWWVTVESSSGSRSKAAGLQLSSSCSGMSATRPMDAAGKCLKVLYFCLLSARHSSCLVAGSTGQCCSLDGCCTLLV